MRRGLWAQGGRKMKSLVSGRCAADTGKQEIKNSRAEYSGVNKIVDGEGFEPLWRMTEKLPSIKYSGVNK